MIQEIQSNNQVAMVLLTRGGHMGFMNGFIPRLPFFSETLCKEYLEGLINLSDIRRDLTERTEWPVNPYSNFLYDYSKSNKF